MTVVGVGQQEQARDNAAVLPELDDVTIVAVSSVALDATARALALSCAQMRFARALLISDRLPGEGLPEGIEWRRIAPLVTRQDYSRFILRDLSGCIQTSHVLVIQWDGYVLDGSAWDPVFLDYDYIGAPWPHLQGFNVGNGGFSLRSRRLLEVVAGMALEDDEQEDLAICRRLRPVLERDFGLRFAPQEVASRFAFERTARSGLEFGFHGVFNMPNLLGIKKFVRVMEGIEPDLIHRNERSAILSHLLRCGALLSSLRLAHRFLRSSVRA